MPSWMSRTGAADGPMARHTRPAIAAWIAPMPPDAPAASSVSSRASARRSVKLDVYPQVGLRIALGVADAGQILPAQPHRDGRRLLEVAPPDLLVGPVDV